MKTLESTMGSSRRWQPDGTMMRRDTRNALMLVEVMVVVTLTSIMMGVVISLMIGLQRWDQSFRDRAVQSEQLARLAESVRTDIRSGADVSLPATRILQTTGQGRGATRYELEAEGCRRIVELPENQATRSEFFAVGPVTSWKLERGPIGRRPLIIVTLDRFAPDNDTAPRLAPLLIYAALGADLPTALAPQDEITP
jgi:hypothetical protein